MFGKGANKSDKHITKNRDGLLKYPFMPNGNLVRLGKVETMPSDCFMHFSKKIDRAEKKRFDKNFVSWLQTKAYEDIVKNSKQLETKAEKLGVNKKQTDTVQKAKTTAPKRNIENVRMNKATLQRAAANAKTYGINIKIKEEPIYQPVYKEPKTVTDPRDYSEALRNIRTVKSEMLLFPKESATANSKPISFPKIRHTQITEVRYVHAMAKAQKWGPHKTNIPICLCQTTSVFQPSLKEIRHTIGRKIFINPALSKDIPFMTQFMQCVDRSLAKHI